MQLTDKERLYVLIVQYGLCKESEYEAKLKEQQNKICKQKVDLNDLLKYIMLRAEKTAFTQTYEDILSMVNLSEK